MERWQSLVIANAEGQPTTPPVVAYTKGGASFGRSDLQMPIGDEPGKYFLSNASSAANTTKLLKNSEKFPINSCVTVTLASNSTVPLLANTLPPKKTPLKFCVNSRTMPANTLVKKSPKLSSPFPPASTHGEL